MRSIYQSSPRTWGCFQRVLREQAQTVVFPTHVGVFLNWQKFVGEAMRLPHARGGVSMAKTWLPDAVLSSPRTWGCFLDHLRAGLLPEVFPTHVGVFPFPALLCSKTWRLPHTRGGVSDPFDTRDQAAKSSPRTWGCFCRSPPSRRLRNCGLSIIGVPALVCSSCGEYYITPEASQRVLALAEYRLKSSCDGWTSTQIDFHDG